MQNLPEQVPDTEIHEMFSVADVDNDGQISYDEFMVRFPYSYVTLFYHHHLIIGHD